MNFRLLPFCTADGPHQMAADEVMLHAAANGRASFRLYAWSAPTASLGYFQSHRVLAASGLAHLSFVRRPSGGLTLVHHHEITYALALSAQYAESPASCWLERMHQVIGKMLAGLGVPTTLAAADVAPPRETCLCFHHITPGDLIIESAKVVGSAQRRQRGALLQHGSILLATSEFTPTLPGIAELTGRVISIEEIQARIAAELVAQMGWETCAGDWSNQEREQIAQLAEQKFQSVAWNEKR